MESDDTVVVGVLYPPEWYGDAEGFEAELEALRALDPRVEVAVATYDEPHELRTARGAGVPAPAGVEPPPIGPELAATLARLDAAIAIDLPTDIVRLAPRLRWVQAVGAGTAQLQAAGLADGGVRLTSNGGSNSIGIAEFAIGRLIEAAKDFPALAEAQTERRWAPLYGRQLAGQTLGLIGYGPINQAVATRAVALGMTVLATRRRVDAVTEPPVERFYGPGQLRDMLARCDAVVAAAPETADTIDLMDGAAFAAMVPGATFVNVGRGSLVDEEALVDALVSGHLGRAALDVTRQEPLPDDDPLWAAPNLALSAHCSSSPSALFANVHRLLRENLARFLTDQPLLNEVSPELGY